jgi:hypothetical protein
MQRRDCLVGHLLEQREVQHFNVKVQYVELMCLATDLVEHLQMRPQLRLQLAFIQTDRLLAHGHEARLRLRARGSKQRHILSIFDQSIAQVSYYTLGAPVKLWRHAFV